MGLGGAWWCSVVVAVDWCGLKNSRFKKGSAEWPSNGVFHLFISLISAIKLFISERNT